jgi:hypothetical protein
MTNRTRFAAQLFAMATLAAASIPATHAADNTRFVSTTGKNSNNCTLAAPCRSLQHGIDVTPAGGELRILDSGFYGANAVIRKSLSVIGNGHTVYLNRPIVINDAGAEVALRSLVLNGQGTANDGIRIADASAVHIERSVIYRFTRHGIFAPASNLDLFVLDTVVRDNGSNGLITAGNGSVRLTIDNSRFTNNGGAGVSLAKGHSTIHRSTLSGNERGLSATGCNVTIMSTVASQNATFGFVMRSGAVVAIDSSVTSGNVQAGIRLEGGTVRLSNSTVTRNGTGVDNLSGALFESRVNNTIRGNNADVGGNRTPFTGL